MHHVVVPFFWFAVVILPELNYSLINAFQPLQQEGFLSSPNKLRVTNFLVEEMHAETTTTTIRPSDIERVDASTIQMPNFDESFKQSQLLMPSIIERALIPQDDDKNDEYSSSSGSCSSIEPFEIINRLDLSPSQREDAIVALEHDDHLLTVPRVLNKEQCAKLRTFITKKMRNDGCVDDVDGCPDYQINISEKKLERILGKKGMDRLWSVPQLLDNNMKKKENNSNASSSSTVVVDRVGIFLRMYRREEGRPWMPFHVDGNQWTVNIALNSDHEYKGGRLLALHNNKLDAIERNEGDVTCHSGSLIHAVSSMQSGTRYSMIMFFHAR